VSEGSGSENWGFRCQVSGVSPPRDGNATELIDIIECGAGKLFKSAPLAWIIATEFIWFSVSINQNETYFHSFYFDLIGRRQPC